MVGMFNITISWKIISFLYDEETLMLYNADTVRVQILSSARDAIMPLNVLE